MISIPKENIPQSEKKILEELKYIEEKYFTFDEPVPFCGLKIYPVTVRNYNNFLSVSECFLLNKNDDPKGIRSSHLDYLISKLNDKENGQIWSLKFSRLLELIFGIENGLKCPKCGKFMSFGEYAREYNDPKNAGKDILACECGGHYDVMIRYETDEKTKKKVLVVDGHVINSKDYSMLRKLPLYQNMPDYRDDSWVHPEVRADQAKKQQILAKKNGPTMASLERKIVCVAAKSSYKINEIYDMSMRKFIMLLGIIDDAITYETTRVGLMTGMVSHKGPIDHWVYKKEKGLYGEATSLESYAGTIAQANGG